MGFKKIEDIREGYAQSLGYRSWLHMAGDLLVREVHIDDIAVAYARQFRDEVVHLTAWKGEAKQVLNDLQLQALGRELGIPLGEEIAKQVLPRVLMLKVEMEGLIGMVEHMYALTEHFGEWEEERSRMKEVIDKYNEKDI